MCPQPQLELVLGLRKFICCPICQASAVDLNSDDFYECRECHTQFSARAWASENMNRMVTLDVPGDEGPVFTVVKSEHGKGDFPSDKAVERWTKACQEWRESRSKRRKKPR